MVSNRRALCVGINVFANYPSAALKGCVNDAHDMAALLKMHVGFKDQDITILTDAQATKANIIGNLKSMLADAKAGKAGYLVFSFSSHGTQVPDTSGDEPDRADEAFCPHDLDEKNGEWDRDHIIVDDELNELFAQLPSNVLLEAFLDTCHSGTGLRDIDMLLDRRPRFLPPPSYEAFEKVRGRRSRGLHVSLLEKGVLHHILWAGCRADQTSADAKIGGSWHGAFTYFLCKHLNAARNRLARKTILQKVRADLTGGHYSQIPQLECDSARKKAGIVVEKLAAAARG